MERAVRDSRMGADAQMRAWALMLSRIDLSAADWIAMGG